jgi:hypothetical protein
MHCHPGVSCHRSHGLQRAALFHRDIINRATGYSREDFLASRGAGRLSRSASVAWIAGFHHPAGPGFRAESNTRR